MVSVSPRPTDAGRSTAGWAWVLALGIVGAAAIAAIWWMAVPRGGICLAIYPAPPGCGDRTDAAVVASAVVLAVCGGLAAVAARLERRHHWLPAALVGAAALTGALAYRAVLLS